MCRFKLFETSLLISTKNSQRFDFLVKLHILAFDLAGLIAGDLTLCSIGRQDAGCDWVDLEKVVKGVPVGFKFGKIFLFLEKFARNDDW